MFFQLKNKYMHVKQSNNLELNEGVSALRMYLFPCQMYGEKMCDQWWCIFGNNHSEIMFEASQLTIWCCSNVSTTLSESCENVAKLRCFNVIKESYMNVVIILSESCENVAKLRCCNVIQESDTNVAITLPQNAVWKHLHNIMATFIFWMKKTVQICIYLFIY